MRALLCLALLGQLMGAQGFVQVSRSNPRYLDLSTGESYIPIGLNIAFERYATDEAEVFARTEARFRNLARNGGNFARIWISHPFYDLDPSASPSEIQVKLQRLDRLVALGQKHGLRLKLCLEHFRTMEKSPPVFPGSVSMGRPEFASRFGDMTAFFTGAPGREWFFKKLDLLAGRYANNPAVFGWELWNEINAVKGSGWEVWTRAMLPELKKRFPRQLALQSLGSFDRESSVEVYRRFSAMPGNEIAQVHRYLDLGAQFQLCHAPVDRLSADAVEDLRSFAQDRPVLLSEVGAVEPNHSGPSKLYEKDHEGVLLHDALFASFFSGAAGPGQFWHWQDYVEKNDLWHHFARFAEAVRGLDPRRERFSPAVIPHDKLRIYALQGQRHTVIWIRDSASGWQSELVQGKAAGTLKDLTLSLPGATADVFDPWTNRHTTVRLRQGQLTLPPFRRSLVLRVEVRRD
jgi:hypothetical protein